MKTVAFYTLGCKVNQVETEQLKEDFIGHGYQVSDFNQPADVYIINTCTVTHVSDRKSRAIIRRAARTNPQALIVVTGCLAQTDPAQIAEIEGVNLVVGNARKQNLVKIIDSFIFKNNEIQVMAGEITRHDIPETVIYSQHHKRTRAFVKIEDGCENFCSYCIVPHARGPVRSKPPDNVLAEVKQLILLGYREVVLTGINTGMYGRDLSGWDLTRLLEYLLEELEGDFRIRLSSIEPLEISEHLIDLAASDKHICRHFHIPIQSGSDRILELMNRRYHRADYLELVKTITRRIPDAAITSDVMVGFPGETETDFEDTYNLIKQLRFFDLHVFKYSPRPGTPAANQEQQVSESEKQKRSEKLINLANAKQKDFLDHMIGKKVTVLIEKKISDNTYSGISDNYINITTSCKNLIPGEFAEIVITGTKNGKTNGTIYHEFNEAAKE
jgi:threonylcarbamoyladenosine tRNA methylthiotransferase MtaB